MNREEAAAAGMEIHETKHSMKRRTPWHDYSRKGTYMLTLVVEGRLPMLGELKGNAEAPLGAPDAPHVVPTVLGRAILDEELAKITHYYPQVEVWKACLMPDHLHLIVRVKEDMPEKKHLGYVVRGFKAGCTKAWWRLAGVETPRTVVSGAERSVTMTGVETPGTVGGAGAVTVPEVSTSAERPSLFEPGYNDKILLHEGQFDNWKAYLDDNPRRLLIKRQNPELFTVLYGMKVAGHSCQIVGNRFLLNVPDKMAVIVHRRYTDEENARLREEWLACGERGGVLVSAAISPKEKEVLREAMDRGYRIILLRENGFPKLYKPVGESFDACSEGLLLQISPWEYHMEQKTITRAQCLELNAMAETIANG